MRNEKQKQKKKENKWQQHKIETFSSILPCVLQFAFVFCSSVDAIVKIHCCGWKSSNSRLLNLNKTIPQIRESNILSSVYGVCSMESMFSNDCLSCKDSSSNTYDSNGLCIYGIGMGMKIKLPDESRIKERKFHFIFSFNVKATHFKLKNHSIFVRLLFFSFVCFWRKHMHIMTPPIRYPPSVVQSEPNNTYGIAVGDQCWWHHAIFIHSKNSNQVPVPCSMHQQQVNQDM